MNRNAIALIAAKTVLGATLALGFLAAPHGVAHADAPVYEDSPEWSCVDDGNKVCGPNNPEGKPAGRYDVGGVLVDPWPVASVTVTVDGVDYPVCEVEDCSDQRGQVGVWTSREGKSYLELGEDVTLPITPGA